MKNEENKIGMSSGTLLQAKTNLFRYLTFMFK